MKNKKILSTETTKETLRLQSLMKKRNEEALKAVEEMKKHPLSREQMIAQAEEMKREAELFNKSKTDKT